MGLIREVQNVGASLNKQERQRRERERLKILQENYTKELQEFLFAEFMQIYNHYDMKTAEEITILKKDDIIQKLYNEIFNRHYLQNSGAVDLVFLPSPSWDKKWRYEQKKEKVFIYRDFDIIGDLNEKYFKVLKQAQKEIYLQKQIENKKLFEKLQKRLQQLMKIDSNKYFLSLTLQQNENIKNIVEDITTDENEKEFLCNNYEKALKQVLKLYSGDITKNKMEIKYKKQLQKAKQQKRILGSIFTTILLKDVAKSLPSPNNPKKRR